MGMKPVEFEEPGEVRNAVTRAKRVKHMSVLNEGTYMGCAETPDGPAGKQANIKFSGTPNPTRPKTENKDTNI